ncbi:hypothetical protein B7494_g6024 [Chlorociboria aeruginascens]|nr:hypothetical protein B7494_g6024 [Chlorociboria aeruginascens]
MSKLLQAGLQLFTALPIEIPLRIWGFAISEDMEEGSVNSDKIDMRIKSGVTSKQASKQTNSLIQQHNKMSSHLERPPVSSSAIQLRLILNQYLLTCNHILDELPSNLFFTEAEPEFIHTSFTPFPRLPNELRLKIWGYVISDLHGSVVTFKSATKQQRSKPKLNSKSKSKSKLKSKSTTKSKSKGKKGTPKRIPVVRSYKTPALLRTNSEARSEVLRVTNYKWCFGRELGGKPIFVDLGRDMMSFVDGEAFSAFFKNEEVMQRLVGTLKFVELLGRWGQKEITKLGRFGGLRKVRLDWLSWNSFHGTREIESMLRTAWRRRRGGRGGVDAEIEWATELAGHALRRRLFGYRWLSLEYYTEGGM